MKFILSFAAIFLVLGINSFAGNTNKGFSKIQSDYSVGKISFEYQLLQKFYYQFIKSKLAPDYNDLDLTPLKCGTETILEFYNHKNEISEEAANEITQILNTPFENTSSSSVYLTPSGKFQITYDISGNNAVPTADNNGNGIPD